MDRGDNCYYRHDLLRTGIELDLELVCLLVRTGLEANICTLENVNLV